MMNKRELVQYYGFDDVPKEAIEAGWIDDGWYYWDKTRTWLSGPFSTRIEAREAQQLSIKEDMFWKWWV